MTERMAAGGERASQWRQRLASYRARLDTPPPLVDREGEPRDQVVGLALLDDELSRFVGVERCLDALAGEPLAVLSNKPQRYLDRIVRKVKLMNDSLR